MRAFDCLLLPSTREGLPLSIVEAHASGLPVIAAPTSGIPEVIQDGITGFLVEANDVEGYAEKIKTVLFNTEYRETIISNASIQCKRDRSWSAYVDKMIGVYRTDLQ
jgi:glycosyltransferase involved in cell wall biosynthesis